jgi:bacillithiol synthase
MATAAPAALPVVHTEPLGGGTLARAATSGDAPASWYVPRPRGAEAWRAHVRGVAREARGGWLDALRPALGADGTPAAERLARVAREGGVLVTTGQQPGLLGGPVYTWSKALGALALADAIEATTGVPAAALFWAATDDADLAEASDTWVALPGGAEHLRMDAEAPEGTPMSAVALPRLDDALAAIARGAGSATNAPVLDLARRAYGSPGATVGGAYVTLLRAMLEPLGVGVLDAAHDAVGAAAEGFLRAALAKGTDVERALVARDAELRAAGHEPQVAQVPGRSLVFAWEGGVKRRLAVDERASAGSRLSPNVLLRPVMERALLPTAAYLAGPGELAYFAQVSAVAATLGAAPPLALPRWSCTIVEPHVERILARLGLGRDELASPHGPERKLARAAMPDSLRDALAAWTAASAEHARRVAGAADGLVQPRVVDGASAWMAHRIARLERRALAAIARRETETMRDLGTARGALHPGGRRQERALNLLPLLARHGDALLQQMLAGARAHAATLVGA